MDEFKQGLQNLEVSAFQAGPVTPADVQAQPQAGDRLCIGLCVGIGFCVGFGSCFGGGFCGGIGGFCGGIGGCFGGGFCRCAQCFRCGGFRCGGFRCGRCF